MTMRPSTWAAYAVRGGLWLVLLAGMAGGCSTSHGPDAATPPGSAEGIAAGSLEAVAWELPAAPAGETSARAAMEPWEALVPDTARFYLPHRPGRALVVWNSDLKSGRAAVHDPTTGNELGAIDVSGALEIRISSVDVAPDGRRLAVADVRRESPAAQCWTLGQPAPMKIPLERPERTVVRFLSNSRLLVAAQGLPEIDQVQVSVWDLESQTQTSRMAVPIPRGSMLEDGAVAVSGGGKYCLIGSRHWISAYEVESGRCLGRFETDPAWRTASVNWRGLSVSPDGAEFAALLDADSSLRLMSWSAADGQSRMSHTVPATFVGVAAKGLVESPALTWTPDGALVLLGAGRLRKEFTSSADRNVLRGSLAISPGGRYLALIDSRAGLDARLQVFDLGTTKHVGEISIPLGPNRTTIEACHGLAFSDDGTVLAAAWSYHYVGSVQMSIWDAASGRLRASTTWGRRPT